jgi:hypothetical protein
MTGDRKYIDWSEGPDMDAEGGSSESPDNVVVMPTPHSGSWHGVWAFDRQGGHEEFYGSRAEVIAWAKEKSATVRVWSEETQDIEPLSAQN